MISYQILKAWHALACPLSFINEFFSASIHCTYFGKMFCSLKSRWYLPELGTCSKLAKLALWIRNSKESNRDIWISTWDALIRFWSQVKTVLVEFAQCSTSIPLTSAVFLPKGTKIWSDLLHSRGWNKHFGTQTDRQMERS